MKPGLDEIRDASDLKPLHQLKQQHTPCRFSPFTGVALTSTSTLATFFRDAAPVTRWDYNPWTGARRHDRDIESDPQGLLILPPGEPILAAPKPAEPTALQRQEGGSHYKDLAIQPIEYIHANNIPFAEGCAIKYLTRWRSKGGIEDLKKARHFIDLLIELETRSKT